MHKTSVYLTEDEWQALRRKAAETGRSQSELIREGVRAVSGRAPRRFRSMAAGEGSGEAIGRHAEDILSSSLRPRS